MALHDDDPGAGRPEGDTLNVSRRAFLKTVSASSVAAGVIGAGESEAQTGPAPVGPGEVSVQLTIDGQARTLKVEPRVTLLDAMRERLDVTAQKRVCDRGSCGACTVLVDGKAPTRAPSSPSRCRASRFAPLPVWRRAPCFIRCSRRFATTTA